MPGHLCCPPVPGSPTSTMTAVRRRLLLSPEPARRIPLAAALFFASWYLLLDSATGSLAAACPYLGSLSFSAAARSVLEFDQRRENPSSGDGSLPLHLRRWWTRPHSMTEESEAQWQEARREAGPGEWDDNVRINELTFCIFC